MTPEQTLRKNRRARFRRNRSALLRHQARLEALHEDGANHAHWLDVPLIPYDEWKKLAQAIRRTERDAEAGCMESAEWMLDTAELRGSVEWMRTHLPRMDMGRPIPTVYETRSVGICRDGRIYATAEALRDAIAVQNSARATKLAGYKAAVEEHCRPHIAAMYARMAKERRQEEAAALTARLLERYGGVASGSIADTAAAPANNDPLRAEWNH